MNSPDIPRNVGPALGHPHFFNPNYATAPGGVTSLGGQRVCYKTWRQSDLGMERFKGYYAFGGGRDPEATAWVREETSGNLGMERSKCY